MLTLSSIGLHRSPRTAGRFGRGLALLVGSLALTLAACSDATPTATASPATSSSPPSKPASSAAKGNAMPIATIDAFIASEKIDKNDPNWKTSLSKPPQAVFSGDETYYWVLETNVGPIRIKLMPDVAPMHVSSTIYLTNLGFYDGVVFHRVINGFMAQGGDPLGKGFGGPGYKYDGEFGGTVRHDKPGMLSMANAGPGTDGSQFFLTFVPTPHLDGKHTIFGEVVDGMETVEALEARGSRSGQTSERLLIETATIVVE